MAERSLESRIDYMRSQIQAGEFTTPAREATAIIETAFRELYQRTLGLLSGHDRMRVHKVEEQIGGGTKTFDEFTLGQMVGLFRNSNFLEAWSKATGNELRGIRMINLDEIVRLRNQLVHSSGTATRSEGELLFQCVQSILETFGVLSLERVTMPADAPTVPAATRGATSTESRASAYRPRGPREGSRLNLQARHAAEFDHRLLSLACEHVGRDDELTVLDIGCADGSATVSRFGTAGYARVVGIDRDPISIGKAQENNPEPDRFSFAVVDVEAFDCETRLKELFPEPPTIIYSALTLHHLASPVKLLRTCRYVLPRPGAVVLRGSDDGSKTAYPDAEDRVTRAIELTLASPGVSDRMNGRKLYSQLYRAGFRRIAMRYDVRDTSGLGQDGRRELFVECFSWRRNYLVSALEKEPDSAELTARLRDLDNLLQELEFDFEEDNFYYAELGYGAVALL